MRKKTFQKVVSIRLTPSVMAVLERDALLREMSVPQYIKMLVIDEAAGARVARIHDEAARTRQLVEGYREDLIFLASNLMVVHGRLTIEEAKKWVDEHFGILSEDDALN
jgi:hypothetical protein